MNHKIRMRPSLLNKLRRTFASATSPSLQRANPEYRVYGENCLLSIQIIAPTFKTVGKYNRLVVSSTGRCLASFIPRIQGGTSSGFSYPDKQSMALSPEELGLILSQMPDLGVHINRQTAPSMGDYTSSQGGDSKRLVVAPSADSSVLFKLTSVDEHGREIGNDMNDGSLEVNVQAGEYEVIKSIWSSSLSSLTGFDTLLKIEMDAAVRDAVDSSPLDQW